MAPSNPLRAAPRPFQRQRAKNERARAIPTGPKREAYNPDDYTEYPLVACNKEDIQDIKTHVMKFQSKQEVKPQQTFTQPVRLHRKETRNLQYQLTRAEIEQRQRENAELKRIAEEERLKVEAEAEATAKHVFDITKDPNVAPEPVKSEEEKRIEKMAKQQQQIAPDGGARKKLFRDKRKTRQVRVMKEADRKLRYEEFYPWVMEDFDGANTWVGAYEAANADTYCLLVMKDNKFTMIPADKVYKFTPRNKYATLTLEEAEARMEKHNTVPRWLMKHLDDSEQKLTRFERTKKKLKTVESATSNENGGRDSDNDALDFDEEFADDEEAPIIDGNEEENKESEKKMKKEMLSAAALDDHIEEVNDVDDLFESRKVDKDGERVRKTLMKTEGAGIYDSDDEINPYINESDLEVDESEEEEIVAADLLKQASPNSLTSRQSSPLLTSRIKVSSVNTPLGMVVLKALPSVLIQFPRGDWNPNLKKRLVDRSSDDSNRDVKRIKLEPSSPSLASVTMNHNGEVKKENLGVAIPEESALTPEDILSIVRSKTNITAKELIASVKHKLKTDESKQNFKLLVKQLLKNHNGVLVPKE